MGVCYANYKYVCIHDLAQVDLNLNVTRLLRRVQLVAGHQPDAGTGGRAPASKEAALQGTTSRNRLPTEQKVQALFFFVFLRP